MEKTEIKTIKFECTRCGVCCTKLFMTTQLGRGGMYLQIGELALFPGVPTKPMYGLGMKGRSRPRPARIVAHQLNVERCPHYKEDTGCTIYEKRPIICRSFPIEANRASRTCPVIEQAVAHDEPFRLVEESVATEREANKRHIEYLMKYRKQKLSNDFWFFDLDENKWCLVKPNDEQSKTRLR